MSGTRRNTYVQRRVFQRMTNRGEQMLLRRITLSPGPEPFKNPPDISADIKITTANTIDGQVYFRLAGTTAIGRLVPGDEIIATGTTAMTWTVVTMPNTVLTDSDGIAQVDGAGTPLFDTPVVYSEDALGWDNCFPVVPVRGTDDPALAVNLPLELRFVAEQRVFGSIMTYEQYTAMGWTEVDAIGLSIAAKGIDPPPQVNDVIIVNNEKRSVLQLGRKLSNGINFLFPVQVR